MKSLLLFLSADRSRCIIALDAGQEEMYLHFWWSMRIIHLLKRWNIWQTGQEWNFRRKSIPEKQKNVRIPERYFWRSTKLQHSIIIYSLRAAGVRSDWNILKSVSLVMRPLRRSVWVIRISTAMTCIGIWSPKGIKMIWLPRRDWSALMKRTGCMTSSGIVWCFRSWMSTAGWSDSAAVLWAMQSQNTWTPRRQWSLIKAGICMAWTGQGVPKSHISFCVRAIWTWYHCIRQDLPMRLHHWVQHWHRDMLHWFTGMYRKCIWLMTVTGPVQGRH